MKVDLGEKVIVPWRGRVGTNVVDALRGFLNSNLWLSRRLYRRELYLARRTA